MTSAASESVATILCNSKQTRFQITNNREVRNHQFIRNLLLTTNSSTLMESTSPSLPAKNQSARENQRRKAMVLRFLRAPNFD
jgi:hypothetical protein